MSILTNIFHNTIGRVLSTSASSQSTKNGSEFQRIEQEKSAEYNINRRRRKREDSNDFEERHDIITKRLRVDSDRYAPIVNGEIFESAAIEGLFAGPMAMNMESTKYKALMPPPSLSSLKSKTEITSKDEEMTDSSLDLDSTSLYSQSQRPANEFSTEHDMEEAKRKALATTLPPNSGVWERSERDLFFHLSYRGFEPLFPQNWMQDFETLPLSLYARADTAGPLIQNHLTKEFRAIRELRELLNVGKNVRDKVLASPCVKKETIIERATNKYISWALSDVGIKLPSSTRSKRTTAKTKDILPIHVTMKLKPRQTIAKGVLDLKHRLHLLAARHRQARDIYISIENDYTGYHTPDATEDETQVVESSEDDLPVLYGILIYRSIFVIFTMNSQTPPPRSWHRSPKHQQNPASSYHPSPTPSGPLSNPAKDKDTRLTMSIDHADAEMSYGNDNDNTAENDEDDPSSDPRFISDFDFSDSKRDVWNALVIAIVAMQIRKDMLQLQQTNHKHRLDPMEQVTAGIEDARVADTMDDHDNDDDDPDL